MNVNPKLLPADHPSFIRRTALRAGCLCAVVLSLLFVAVAQADDAALLKAGLDKILTDYKQRDVVFGARVIELPTGRILYNVNGTQPMIPASNMKLIVMAAAIDTLGVDHTFQTVVGIRDTDLVVIGGGDPTIGDEVLAKDRHETITALFHTWVSKLQEAGVEQIPGNIVIDDFIFDQEFVHKEWPDDQYQKWYEAPVGGLNFNANCTSVEVEPTKPGEPADVRLIPGNTYLTLVNKTQTGSENTAVINRQRDSDTIVVSGTVSKKGVLGPITVRDPGLYFGSVLKTVLASKGIRVHGKVVREKIRFDDGTLPRDVHIVAVHRSPLSDVLQRAGKNSLGMMAEALFKYLGHKRSGVGSWKTGAEAVEAFLDKLGIPDQQRTIDEGSGLSRLNRLSPAIATQVLKHVYNTKGDSFKLLQESLAVAGTDGTMRKRLRSAGAKGRVFAKTGYVNGVRTLAGYVHTQHDRWLAFAIYYNNAKLTYRMRQLQDQACDILVKWPELRTASAAQTQPATK